MTTLAMLQRLFATPLTIGAFLVSGATGAILFFAGNLGGLVTSAHEWIGLLFIAAGIWHVIRNGPAFLAYCRKRSAVLAVAGVLAVGAVLVTVSMSGPVRAGQGGRQGYDAVADRLYDAPLYALAPALGITAQEAQTRLGRIGVTVWSDRLSIREIINRDNLDDRQQRALLLAVAGVDGS